MQMNPSAVPSHIAAACACDQRSDQERNRDAGRKPDQIIAFFGVEPGMKVGEIQSGGGYFSGLLAAVVGEAGHVYAHNAPSSIARRKGVNPIEERIKDYGLTNMTPLVGPVEAPGFPAVLDAIFMIMTYHDACYSDVDRAVLNKAVFECLKPGGIFGILDHAAQPGKGFDDAHECHRIEKCALVEEVTQYGFTLVGESDCLENESDTRDKIPFEKGLRDHTCRFVVKFTRPVS
jgi:predicted methyltransferase